jgi:hypothetical protein
VDHDSFNVGLQHLPGTRASHGQDLPKFPEITRHDSGVNLYIGKSARFSQGEKP